MHVLQVEDDGGVDEGDHPHHHVQRCEPKVFHQVARYHWAECISWGGIFRDFCLFKSWISYIYHSHRKLCGTCAVGYIRNGIDGAIDSGVLLVHDEAKHGEEGGVDEGDPEADDADWKHEDKEVAGEGDEEAGNSLQHKTNQGERPLKSQNENGVVFGIDKDKDVLEGGNSPNSLLVAIMVLGRGKDNRQCGPRFGLWSSLLCYCEKEMMAMKQMCEKGGWSRCDIKACLTMGR